MPRNLTEFKSSNLNPSYFSRAGIMSSIISYLPFIFGRTTSPDPLEPSVKQEKNSKLLASGKKVTANVPIDRTKPLSERELAFRNDFLGRVLTFLTYRSQLEQAESNCKKFLKSFSGADFQLSTAVPLLAKVDGIGNPNFKKLFQKTINDTLKKLAQEAKTSGRLAEVITTAKNNSSQVFIPARKNNYVTAFRITEEYRTALAAINENKPVQANWTITVPLSSKKRDDLEKEDS